MLAADVLVRTPGGTMTDNGSIDVPIIALDIESSSARVGISQARLHQALRTIFDQACTEIKLKVPEGDRADRGDGDVIVVRAPVEVARLVADLSREFTGALDQFNRDRSENARLRIRMAIHRGPVWGHPGRWDGHAIVDTGRILDSQTSRELLKGQRGAAVVLSISQVIFDAAVREQQRFLDPADWTPFELGESEKGTGLRAWGRLLGAGTAAASTIPAAAPSGPQDAPAADDLIRMPGARVVQGSTGPFALGDDSPVVGGSVHGDVTGRKDG